MDEAAHVVTRGTKWTDPQGSSQGASDNLHSLVNTNNNNFYFDLETDMTPSEQNKHQSRKPLALWNEYLQAVYTWTYIHIHMLERKERLESERGKCYVTCEREETMSEGWAVGNVKVIQINKVENEWQTPMYEVHMI